MPRQVTFHIVGDAYVDFFCFLDGDWPENGGDSRLDQPVKLYAGGSSTNTATHLKALTKHFCKQHDDAPEVILQTVLNPQDQYGKMLLQHAKTHDFPLVNCRQEEDHSLWTGHCIAIVSGGERSFMTHQGLVERFRASDLDIQEMIKTQTNLHVHVAGYFNVVGYHNGNLRDELIRLRQGRSACGHSTTVSLVTQHDASKQWDGGLDQVIPYLDFLIMNELEANRIWKRGRRQQNQSTTPSKDPVQDWVSFFSPMNPRVCVIVTLGPEGAVAFSNGKILATLRPAIHVKAIDPTGAGDSFTAGFLHGLWSWKHDNDHNSDSSEGWPAPAVAQGLLWGCAVGTAAVTIRGASNPSAPKDIQDLLDKQQEKNAVECHPEQLLSLGARIVNKDGGSRQKGSTFVLVPADASVSLQTLALDDDKTAPSLDAFIESYFPLQAGETVDMDLVQQQADAARHCTTYTCPHVSPVTLQKAAAQGTMQRVTLRHNKEQQQVYMYYDESANLKRRPRNARACQLYSQHYTSANNDDEVIYGDVFLADVNGQAMDAADLEQQSWFATNSSSG